MTVTFLTPPGPLADTLTPIVFTVTEGVIAVSAEFRYEDGNGLWETIYQDGRFSYAYSGSTIEGGTWTVRRSTPWPADVRVLVDEAASGTGGPNPPSLPPPPIGAVSDIGAIGAYATETHTHAHGNQAGGSLHALATATTDGFFSHGDKNKLDSIDPAELSADIGALELPSYVTLSASGALANERVLTEGPGITIAEDVPAGKVTIASAVQSVFGRIDNVVAALGDYTSSLVSNASAVAGATVSAALDALSAAISSLSTTVSGKAPVGAQYVTLAADAALTGQRVLTPGSRISFTDGGAGGNLTVNASGEIHTWTIVDGDPYPAVTSPDDMGKVVQILGEAGGFAWRYEIYIGDVEGPTWEQITLEDDLEYWLGTKADRTAAFIMVSGNAGGPVDNTRVLTQGTGISLVDSGPNGTLTINATGGGGGAPTTAQYLTLAADATLSNERVLTASYGMSQADGGAGGALRYRQLRSIISTPASRTLALTDSEACVWVMGGVATDLTIPDNTAVPFDIGTTINVLQWQGQTVRVLPGAGVTLYDQGVSVGSATVRGNAQLVSLFKVAINTWLVYGSSLGADAPGSASYLTLAADAKLTNERILTAGPGISITDGGAGGAVTIAASHLYKAAALISSFVVATGAETVATLTKSYDTNNNLTSTTYTVPVTGYYSVGMRVEGNFVATGNFTRVKITINGAAPTKSPVGYGMGNPAAYVYADVDQVLQLNAGDTLQASIFQDSGANRTYNGWFYVHFLST